MLFYVIISQKRGNMFLFYIDESGEIAYNSGSKYFVFNALVLEPVLIIILYFYS